MSILFSDIYEKAFALFDDPKITIAYQTNRIQFNKLMYTFMQNALSMFVNPASIAVKLASFKEPYGALETFEADGKSNTFTLDADFDLIKEGTEYVFYENNMQVKGEIDYENRTVTFPDVLPQGQEYGFEEYYCGEFTGEFDHYHMNYNKGDTMITSQVIGIMARLLIKAWGEEKRNMLLDIQNIMQDSDFKLTGNDKILNAKNAWINQLDTEILAIQNRLAWSVRFMQSSSKLGRG